MPIQTPQDMLGRELAEGDHVAYAVGSGSSISLTAAVVHELRPQRERVAYKSSYYGPRWETCDASVAERICVYVSPIKSTGYMETHKPRALRRAENLIRLEPFDE
jgi:hypothetical protein